MYKKKRDTHWNTIILKITNAAKGFYLLLLIAHMLAKLIDKASLLHDQSRLLHDVACTISN